MATERLAQQRGISEKIPWRGLALVVTGVILIGVAINALNLHFSKN